VGTRFRPQGREPELGLDCVGLAGCAAGIPAHELPRDYALRSEAGEAAMRFAMAGRIGTVKRKAAGEGDILLVRCGPGQHHLVVLVAGGFVHADAGLRRVVEVPGAVPWPVLAAWRVAGED
jgi:hypothetical protein